MVAIFESEGERYNDVKPVIELKQASRADGDEPKEKNMVSKKNSFDVILDILENLVVGVTKTINVVNTISLLTNEKKLEDVVEEIKQNSRRFAKRQYTFFKHQFDTTWFDVDLENFENTINDVLEFIEK